MLYRMLYILYNSKLTPRNNNRHMTYNSNKKDIFQKSIQNNVKQY